MERVNTGRSDGPIGLCEHGRCLTCGRWAPWAPCPWCTLDRLDPDSPQARALEIRLERKRLEIEERVAALEAQLAS